MAVHAVQRSELATTGEEYRALIASDATWVVRSPDDLRNVRSLGAGPLSNLTQRDFDAFAAGLTFKGGGVVTGSYRPLMATMTMSEIFEVFEAFGMSREYTLDTLEARCDGTSCSFEFWSFCTSMCGTVLPQDAATTVTDQQSW